MFPAGADSWFLGLLSGAVMGLRLEASETDCRWKRQLRRAASIQARFLDLRFVF